MAKPKFEEYENKITCTINRKGCVGYGVATLNPEDKKSKMTGETIAYYKAERSFIKNKIKAQKSIITYLDFLKIYLFPWKLCSRHVDWIKDRFDRLQEQEANKLSTLLEEYEEINSMLQEYIDTRKQSLEVIKKFKERKKDLCE